MRKILNIHFIKIAIASFALIASAFVVTQYNHYKDLRQGYLNTAQRISQGLSSHFSFFYHNIQNIAYNRSIRLLNKRESVEYFDSLVALYPYYDVIVLSDVNGNYVASNTIGAEGEALDVAKARSEKFFTPSGEASADEDLKKGFMGSFAHEFGEHPAVSGMYGRTKYGIGFSAPVRLNSGKIVGYVSSFINEKWLSDELRSLSDEFLNPSRSKFDIYLLNKNQKTLASNKTGIAPLAELPFEIATANFSKFTAEGNIPEGLASFSKFVKHPLFVVSKFNHQNFLSKMGWSLVVKMDKKLALSSMVNNLAWFWGAFLLFLMVAQGMNLRAGHRLEKLWKIKEREGELSFEEALERAQFKETAKDALKSLARMKQKTQDLIPKATLGEASPNIAWEKSLKKTRRYFTEGAEELQVLKAGHASLRGALKKRKEADEAQAQSHEALGGDLTSAAEALQELRVFALNLEIAEEMDVSSRLRELDAKLERVFFHFDLASRSVEALGEIRISAGVELANSWKVEQGRFHESWEKAKNAFEGAAKGSEEMGTHLGKFEEISAKSWEKTKVLLEERSKASSELKELVAAIESLENLLMPEDHTEEEIKKAA